MPAASPAAAAPTGSPPRHVVVLGAGLAGAFAAAAASGGGRQVTVVERDLLPDEVRPRRGVPQGRHAHVYLLRGLRAADELLPGFSDELRAAGAVPFDTGDLAWLGETGWAPVTRQFEVLSATRPLFESVVLRRVRALPGVAIHDAATVQAIERDRSAGWSVLLADGSRLAADLVIDATGRSSRLPEWLQAAGVPPAATSEVDARVGYATRTYAVDGARVGAAGIVLAQTPARRTGGLALPVEGGRWLVGAVGSGERRPPRDAAAFSAFLDDLHDSALTELTGLGRAEGDVAVHRQTANRRRHYERMRAWPAGLLVIGDALCAFNPVYGQGVTVAACQALELRDALGGDLRPGWERRLLRRFAGAAAVPWAIATGEDLRYPASAGRVPPLQAVFAAWTRELGRLATHGDIGAHTALARVYHLMAPPSALLHPRLLAAAVRARLRGYGPLTARPHIVT